MKIISTAAAPICPCPRRDWRNWGSCATTFTRPGLSPAECTDETLKALFGNVPFTVDARFREVNFGSFEMKSYDTLKDNPAYQAWITGDNEANVPPQGESGVQMTRRVLTAFSELPDGTALICHGGVIAVIMAACFPAEGKHRYQWQPLNGHGYELSGDTYRPIP